MGRFTRTTITFDGGRIALDLHIVDANTSSDIAMFLQAAGTLSGTDFSQADYYKLVFSAAHHLMTQDFAVLFHTPIDGACGLRVLDASRWRTSRGPAAGQPVHLARTAPSPRRPGPPRASQRPRHAQHLGPPNRAYAPPLLVGERQRSMESTHPGHPPGRSPAKRHRRERAPMGAGHHQEGASRTNRLKAHSQPAEVT